MRGCGATGRQGWPGWSFGGRRGAEPPWSPHKTLRDLLRRPVLLPARARRRAPRRGYSLCGVLAALAIGLPVAVAGVAAPARSDTATAAPIVVFTSSGDAFSRYYA